MTKTFYEYKRKSNNNNGFNFERIPKVLDSAIISYQPNKIILPTEIVPYSDVSYDSIGISLNKNGSFNLPRGTYLISFELLCRSEKTCNSTVTLNVGSNVIYTNYDNLLPECNKTINGIITLNVTSIMNSYSLVNSGNDNLIGVISELSPTSKMVILKLS